MGPDRRRKKMFTSDNEIENRIKDAAATERINARMRLLTSQVSGITLGITREPTLETLNSVQALIDRAIDGISKMFDE
jgi:hypothetical protein